MAATIGVLRGRTCDAGVTATYFKFATRGRLECTFAARTGASAVHAAVLCATRVHAVVLCATRAAARRVGARRASGDTGPVGVASSYY